MSAEREYNTSYTQFSLIQTTGNILCCSHAKELIKEICQIGNAQHCLERRIEQRSKKMQEEYDLKGINITPLNKSFDNQRFVRFQMGIESFELKACSCFRG